MRITLAVLVLSAIVALGAVGGPVSALQTTPGITPVETDMGPETDIIKWGVTQGALTLVLMLVLISYRRDFFRKHEVKQGEIDALREEKRMLSSVIEKNADAMVRQAVSVNANTDATRLLAQNVNSLAERRQWER